MGDVSVANLSLQTGRQRSAKASRVRERRSELTYFPHTTFPPVLKGVRERRSATRYRNSARNYSRYESELRDVDLDDGSLGHDTELSVLEG